MSITLSAKAIGVCCGLPAQGGLPAMGYAQSEPYGPMSIGFSRGGADVMGLVLGEGYGWQLQGLPAQRGLPAMGHTAHCVDVAAMSGLPAQRGLPAQGGLPRMGRISGLPAVGAMNPQCDYPGGTFRRPGESEAAFEYRSNVCAGTPEVAEWYETLGQQLLTTAATVELTKYAADRGVQLPPAKPPVPYSTAEKAGIGAGVIAGIAVIAAVILSRRRK